MSSIEIQAQRQRLSNELVRNVLFFDQRSTSPGLKGTKDLDLDYATPDPRGKSSEIDGNHTEEMQGQPRSQRERGEKLYVSPKHHDPIVMNFLA
jgi:hypothetical protein